MIPGTAAAPRRRRQAGLLTVLSVTLAALGFASSQALAGPSVVGQVGTGSASTPPATTAPHPDPQPSPKPDPKPASRPKPPPPPPPPPPAAPRTQAPPPPAPPEPPPPPPPPPEEPVAKPKAATPKVKPARRPRAKAKRPAPREESVAPPSVFENSLDEQAAGGAPGLVIPSDPSPPSVPPLVLPMIGLGLLLVGGSTISARRVPWPTIAMHLDSHRVELAVGGAAAIAFALLWLNAAVFF